MAITTYVRGHKIYIKDNKWFYEDSNEPFDDNRPCKNCGRFRTEEGYDACLGKLDKVKNACCGHGRNEDRYIQYI